jgi:hypothetical protein
MDHITSFRTSALYAVLCNISPAIGASQLTARQEIMNRDDLSRAGYLITLVNRDNGKAPKFFT